MLHGFFRGGSVYVVSFRFVLFHSLRSRRIKGRGWGRRKRIREKRNGGVVVGGGGGGAGGRNACHKDPYWFIFAVVDGRKILIG